MDHGFLHKFQLVCRVTLIFLGLLSFHPFSVRASQLAIVQAEKAILYSDQQMTSALGFVKKGKKIKVGEIPRNLGQVYPVIVSGKRAWIRVIDVTTEKESTSSGRLTAERFAKKAYQDQKRTLYSLSLMQFASQITLDHQNGELSDQDSLDWTGLSLRGEAWVSSSWDLEVIMNYLMAKKSTEEFKMFEIGGGSGYKLYQGSRLTIKLDGQALLIPFSSYALDSLYRKRGYGYTVGGGLNVGYKVGTNWGIEGYGGFYYTKLIGFDAPEPYEPINPSFVGSRIGIGVTYQL